MTDIADVYYLTEISGHDPNVTPSPLSDAEIEDMGMYRCGCGVAVYPNGDPNMRHCRLDRP